MDNPNIKIPSDTEVIGYGTHQELFIERDTEKLRWVLKDHEQAHLLTIHGNLGDQLIQAGTRALLGKIGVAFDEMHISAARGGKVALIMGGGSWCRTWEAFISEHLPIIESRYDKVIVLPSSYQMTERIHDTIRKATKTLFLAREIISYNQIRRICDAYIMHDLAFHFDFTPHIKTKGNGNGNGGRVLNSYRLDAERMAFALPEFNVDTSSQKYSLEEWLRQLGEYDIIKTDRAHVMIAGAMMHKMVLYRASNYHKVPAIADFSLKGLAAYPG